MFHPSLILWVRSSRRLRSNEKSFFPVGNPSNPLSSQIPSSNSQQFNLSNAASPNYFDHLTTVGLQRSDLHIDCFLCFHSKWPMDSSLLPIQQQLIFNHNNEILRPDLGKENNAKERE